MPPEPAGIASVAHDRADDQVREHACPSRAHDQCGSESAVDTPTTGPGPHPQPLVLPARPDTRPAVASPATTPYTAGPRAPDLHLLQVLRI
ncbi:hypothetical protein P1P75_05465 [Streptomyces sp. ID05-39B]|nr:MULTISPECIES: hypothetical protein [unclassified Streptomyces]MDX3525894.1 hypothetical protein [Streptomyces sp. ID05-39B]